MDARPIRLLISTVSFFKIRLTHKFPVINLKLWLELVGILLIISL
jgi:hypothetical protein